MQFDFLAVDFEKALEGAVLVNPSCFFDLIDIVKPNYFSIHRNKWIWEAFESLVQKEVPIDFLTVGSELKRKGQLEEVGGTSYLISLVNDCPTSLNAMAYGEELRKNYLNRRTIDLALSIAQNGTQGNSLDVNLQYLEDFMYEATEMINPEKRLIMSAEELCNSDIPDLNWIVKDWIVAGGLNLIAGMPAAGKTILVEDLVIGMATNGKAWNNLTVEKGKVLYQYLDGSVRGVRTRIAKMCSARNVEFPKDLVFDFSPVNLNSPTEMISFRRRIKQLGVTTVVLDVLAKYIPGADENSVSEITPVMNALRDMANKEGITFIIIHHLNKGATNDYSQRIRGSIEILGSVDTAIVVTQDHSGKNNIKRNLIPQKNRESEMPDALSFRIVSNDESISLEFFSEEKNINKASVSICDKAYDEIVKIISQYPTKKFTKKELVDQIKIIDASTHTFDRAFSKLSKNDHVVISKNSNQNYYSWIVS